MRNEDQNKTAIDNQALRASELSYRRLFEAAQDGILILDVETGRIDDVNPFLTKLLGFSHQEMVGKTVGELSPFKDIESNQAMLERLQQHGYVRYEDLPLETRDGRRIAVEFVSNVYQAGNEKVIQCNIRDITERKKSEQRLKLLNTCISNLSDVVLVTEADPIDEPGPRIVFVNEALERITGYTPAEALGRCPRFLQGEKTDPGTRQEIRQALIKRQPIRKQIINYKKDGTAYWMDISIVPIFDAAGTCTHFAAIERDVTEAKNTEDSLKLFRALIDQSNDAIEVIDSVSGRFLDVNDTACQRLGYSREEMLTLTLSDIIDATQETFSMEANLEEIRKKGFRINQSRHRRKDGSTFPIEVNVKYIDLNQGYLLAVVRDITDRQRAEEQIAEQAEFLDKARDAILVRDLAGNIIFWNKGAERIYGWTRQEVMGRNVGELLYLDAKKFTEAHERTLNQAEWNGELQHLTKSRKEITVEARWTLIRDQEGHPKSVLSINTDITERKKIEAQLMRAQRMESIGTLAGGIAHDLNNILAPIVLSIDILRRTSTNPQAKDILETLMLSARRGADIVRQVLFFARGIEGERIEVHLCHLLNDLESIIKNVFPKNIRLRFSIPDDAWAILGDPTQIHQILLNLCVNARDAMPEGGNLTISVENRLLDAQYATMHMQAKPGRYVNISVTDSGLGMAPGVLDKIFEPFFTTKEPNKGTGLGLSTVMAIVKSHGGLVNVYSEPNKGTSFQIYLPAMNSSSDSVQEQVEQNNLPRGNNETVLVVDDEESILDITRQTLLAFGYQVLTAVNGADAVAVYAEHKNEIAVVLVDMMMPVMDGQAAIHALRRINAKVKIIAASGLVTNGGVVKVSGATINHFLTKPYTAEVLLKSLQAILGEVST